ncbi:S41 family peptidase [Catenovulum sp. 2E275]|uniref:S41 family peptidase n=1 Tax=Catenovulum sp. 2E275 TaxID=2980497 RepID=UPI0021CEB4A1|nr:S41 family peptidase [Catenovulum sp. 2E275]MCU4674846.1 S41 family peptidase [Catenovulum sp. 2E275]
MHFTVKTSLCALSIAVLSACGGSSSSESTPSKAEVQQKCTKQNLHSFWYDTLEFEYLWLDELANPTLNFSEYIETNHLLYDVLPARDRFSFALPTDQWNATISGESFGFGAEFGPVGNELIVYQVYKNSPAETAGLKRGDKIIKIADVDAPTIIAWLNTYNSEAIADLFGPDTKGYKVKFHWQTPTNSTKVVAIPKDEIDINTVAHYSVQNTNAGKVAYLAFPTGFYLNSAKEIDEAFAYFKAEQPDQFILDLRDNGGGLLSVAARLSLYLAGDKLGKNTFLQITHNYRLASFDSVYSADTMIDPENGASYNTILQNSLNLDKLIVLTNGYTASASESVINGLTPYLDIYQIGQRTYGKPVGFYANDGSYDKRGEKAGFEVCNETLLALNFQTENANGFANYMNGLPVNCAVTNDYPTGDWSTLSDPAQITALNYAQNNSCISSAAKGIKTKNTLQQGIKYQEVSLPGMILDK